MLQEGSHKLKVLIDVSKSLRPNMVRSVTVEINQEQLILWLAFVMFSEPKLTYVRRNARVKKLALTINRTD